MSRKKKMVLINLALGAAIVALVAQLSQGYITNLWHRLHNGCFVATAMLLGSGGIRAVGNTGSFDALGYSMKTTLHTFMPMLKENGPNSKEEDFLTYKERKSENRKSAADLLIAGGVYFVLSLITLALYYLL